MKRDPNRKYHRHVIVEDPELEDYKNQVKEIVRLMRDIFAASPLDICNVEFFEIGRAGDGTAYPRSIWFEQKTTIEKILFSKSVNADRRLRGMSTLGNLEFRRARLFQRMEI
jgi:hypothetical protein